jgi:hypothetical protein
LPPARSRPSSIEFHLLVDYVEADLDADRRESHDGVAFDDLVRPTIAGTGVEVIRRSSCSMIAYCWIEDVAKEIEFLAAAILARGTGR